MSTNQTNAATRSEENTRAQKRAIAEELVRIHGYGLDPSSPAGQAEVKRLITRRSVEWLATEFEDTLAELVSVPWAAFVAGVALREFELTNNDWAEIDAFCCAHRAKIAAEERALAAEWAKLPKTPCAVIPGMAYPSEESEGRS